MAFLAGVPQSKTAEQNRKATAEQFRSVKVPGRIY
jgi:hypothetical protein